LTAIQDRYCGALIGLACGDAVGTTVEFMGRGTFPDLTDMVGGWRLRCGASGTRHLSRKQY
jgi:ADP-ribosylglycohydrolase